MSSGTYNIPRSLKDGFCRYKMPRLQAKIEGKGNGIKTVLPNIVDVARALSRPPAYPAKYFGNELGAQVQIEEKSEKYIVNGAHEVSKLQDVLDGFIDRYVLCPVCKNPETDLIIKDKMITRKCGACGERTDVDMRHGLAKYIVNHPPPKEKKGGQHASAGNGSGGEGDDADGIDGLVQNTNKLALVDEDDVDDDDWALGIDVDMSAEAVAQRQKDAEARLAVIDKHATGEDAEDGDDPYDQLGDFIRANREASDREIFAKATELQLGKKHRAVIVVILCLFEESAMVAKDIAKHDKLLVSFGDSDKHQRAVIGGFERLIEERPELLAKTPAIFKALFDEEIVEEEAFLEWGKKPSKKYVDKELAKKIHKAAEPFIQWLAEAEEASDSDEDDEE
ncbi:eukaryotic translation initiation factor 5 [Coemansia furcata]|uniref:Eukaryotic translation initiation factor 5 n=1 Tax=Coemansia furcata TaxID=417177 RepID=A0ACC1L0R7_9FUNG|nr:eukaryotic translation initiation factor 5 [Coemansia furcata]